MLIDSKDKAGRKPGSVHLNKEGGQSSI